MHCFRQLAICAATTLWLFAVAPRSVLADTVHVAVASNFAPALDEIAKEFSKKTQHQIVTSSGSTAKIYTQITQGAPFEVFLSADQEHPRRLEADGFSVPNTRFPYAIGKLVLWSRDAGLIDSDGKVLRGGQFTHLAIADPRVAPYGAAAKEVLEAQGLWDTLRSKLVFGDNIAQTQQFISSGNAKLGFIALAQIPKQNGVDLGSFWIVPQKFYTPITQEAVLLKRGETNPAAKDLLDFLKAPTARSIIERNGYALP